MLQALRLHLRIGPTSPCTNWNVSERALITAKTIAEAPPWSLQTIHKTCICYYWIQMNIFTYDNCITLCSLTLPMKHSILNHQYVSIFRSMDPFFWKRSDFKTNSQIKSSTIIQIKQLTLKLINQYPISKHTVKIR